MEKIDVKSESHLSQTGQRSESDEKREKLGSKVKFLLSCIALSVGLGNIWRFPYFAYENGGGKDKGAFLIPYFILLIFVGIPMYFMELALGQYCGTGPLRAFWRLAPVSLGVGAAMLVISLVVTVYYAIILTYTIFYLAASLAAEVPWGRCMEKWGADELCFARNQSLQNMTTYTVGNVTYNIPQLQTPSEQYWKKAVLHLPESSGLGDLGEVRWDLTLCLLLTWIIVYLCLFKGIKFSGKAVYFTATFPYIILLILLVRSVTLQGASKGIKYLFIPEWSKLASITVWAKAADQMFYSLGISWGGLIVSGSYNNFKQKVYQDAVIVGFMDFMTSVVAGIVIFSVLGALASELKIDVKDVTKSGPGLAFIVYPEALARLPVSQLWSVLFFLMLFILGLGSEFPFLETVLSAVYDDFPKARNHKPIVCFVVSVICFLLGLPCVTSGGQYVFNLMDFFCNAVIIGSFEMVAVMWIYGVVRFCDNIEYMLGFRPNIFWNVCWAGLAPISLSVLFAYFCVDFIPPTYDGYVYPTWGIGVGWLLLLISALQIPICAIGAIIYHWRKGDIKQAFRPTSSWGPNDGSDKVQ